jgi:hypothetical protein
VWCVTALNVLHVSAQSCKETFHAYARGHMGAALDIGERPSIVSYPRGT